MLKSGEMLVPLAWFRYSPGGEVHGEGFRVDWDNDVSDDIPHEIYPSPPINRVARCACVTERKSSLQHRSYTSIIMISQQMASESASLVSNEELSLTHLLYQVHVCSSCTGNLPSGVYNGENPLRAVAKGRRMYTSFVKAWGDDVSGNRSKQYNEHTNIYLAHANLPHSKLSQEYFVRFCSTSPTAGAGAQFDALVQSVSYVQPHFDILW